MSREKLNQEAEQKIAVALSTGATELDLSGMELTELPESLGELTQLQELNLSGNQLTALPESLGELTQLQELNLDNNRFATLPNSVTLLGALTDLHFKFNPIESFPPNIVNLENIRHICFGYPSLSGNRIPLDVIPESFGELKSLKELLFGSTTLIHVPRWIAKLKNLENLTIVGSKVNDLPFELLDLERLQNLSLKGNPLTPELAAAHEQGLDAVKKYLRAKAEDQIVLNEAKLILIGEGEVGKSCLLDALRGDPWQKHDSTHGIEIKPVHVTHCDGSETETEITLNTWDFGGQKVYRPTHQLFFSAPAVYLVVWKPREGPQQGAVEYWINSITHRAGSEAKVLIVATHGGPQQRQMDIDLQDLRDKFGADCVLGAFHVDNRPEHYDDAKGSWTGERKGIAELTNAIAEVADSLSNVGREVATSWNNVVKKVQRRSEKKPYITYKQFEVLCSRQKVNKALAKTYAGMLNQLGYVIHYGIDDDLKEIMILKPDWLAKAISFVLDDKTTRERNGLVSYEHLTQLWSNPPYEYEEGYPDVLHPLFQKLMERFDISYQVVVDPASSKPITTSLVAQLVDDQPKHLPDWDEIPQPGDEEKRQICQIVERDKNQSANAEGLFFRLIARLHKYSLGREDYDKSVHWQRGLMLDDGYNGRALLRQIGNDVHITVRAAYPEFLLFELTRDVKELVENSDQGWAGLRCEIVVPCIAPCGLNNPGRGRFDVRKLALNKKNEVNTVLCPATDCDQFHSVDELMRNATVTRQSKLTDSDIDQIRETVGNVVGDKIDMKDKKDLARIRALYRKMSQADEQLAILMQMGLDEARNGPRIFSLTPTDTDFLDNPSWVTQKFRLTLWCEHSRKPLPGLWKDKSRGVYKLEQSRDWLKNYGPALRIVNKTLSAMLPVIAATTKIAIPGDTYKGIENELNLGKELFGAVLKGSGALADVSGDDIFSDTEHFTSDSEHGTARKAQNAMLRELHAILKERDPGFGGLVRVQNKRRVFLWVHPQFEDEY